jgi:hypothetical protein
LRIQHGQLTAKFERYKNDFGAAEDHSFSILYDDLGTSLDLLAANKEEFLLWYDGLKQLLKKYYLEQEKLKPFTRYLRSIW